MMGRYPTSWADAPRPAKTRRASARLVGGILFRRVVWRCRELSVFAGDQIIRQREAGHCLEAGGPGFQMGPIPHLEPALGHEHHAAPAADIRDRALVADEKGLALHRIVDKRQRRLGRLRPRWRLRPRHGWRLWTWRRRRAPLELSSPGPRASILSSAWGR